MNWTLLTVTSAFVSEGSSPVTCTSALKIRESITEVGVKVAMGLEKAVPLPTTAYT
jgi:hypothetical protein